MGYFPCGDVARLRSCRPVGSEDESARLEDPPALTVTTGDFRARRLKDEVEIGSARSIEIGALRPFLPDVTCMRVEAEALTLNRRRWQRHPLAGPSGAHTCQD